MSSSEKINDYDAIIREVIVIFCRWSPCCFQVDNDACVILMIWLNLFGSVRLLSQNQM